MVSQLSDPQRAFRIADMRHTIFDGSGAMIHGARWNSPGRRVIYAAETYAGALLEILVHASGSVPRSQGYVEIEIPSGLSIEEITQDDLPRWDAPSFEATQAFGDRWYDECRTPAFDRAFRADARGTECADQPGTSRISRGPGQPSRACTLGCACLLYTSPSPRD